MDLNVEFDQPVFKVLATNDTGAAPGHQGGIVIPRELEQYFPRLQGKPTADSPTLDADVTLELWVGDKPAGIVQSRYQFQTWGGVRSPERRLTGGFSDWRNEAVGGDIAVFERNLRNEYYYRLRLIRAADLTSDLIEAISGRRWGVVDPHWAPAANDEIESAESEILGDTVDAESLFANRHKSLSHSQIIARNHAFRSAVLRAYRGRCVITNEAIFAPSGSSSCDAAHIIPVSAGGADLVQNGIALRKDLHWAFDQGLWSIDNLRRVVVSDFVSNAKNELLCGFNGQVLRNPDSGKWSPLDEAFAWHRHNRFLR